MEVLEKETKIIMVYNKNLEVLKDKYKIQEVDTDSMKQR